VSSSLWELRGAGPVSAPRLRLGGLAGGGLTLALAACAAIAWLVPGADGGLAYDRDALAAGELWRILTGHWVHWSRGQFLWNVGTFLVLGLVCEARGRLRFATCVLGAALAVPAAVFVLVPEMNHYGGLSGIESALFALAAVDLIRERWSRMDRTAAVLGIALGLGFVCKIAWEMATGGAVFAGDLGPGVAPVPVAHMAGAAVGIVAAFGGKGHRGHRPRLDGRGAGRRGCS
jgi:rhomboid family GlyGly-CTERM serine protease